MCKCNRKATRLLHGVQTTVHAALGKWLDREQQRGQETALPEEVHHFTKPGHPSVVLWGARICLSLGSLIVVIVVCSSLQTNKRDDWKLKHDAADMLLVAWSVLQSIAQLIIYRSLSCLLSPFLASRPMQIAMKILNSGGISILLCIS